jgi:AcrR family transcriptional regulator
MPVTRAKDTARHDRKLAGILQSACRVFAQEGYDRASIRLVAEEAGVSVPGIYHYVRSKEELLFLIQHRAFDDLVQRFDEDSPGVKDPTARLELLIRNHLERFVANMEELIVCSREIDRLRGSFLEQVQAVQRKYFSKAVQIFKEIARVDGAPRVEPRVAALAMFGSINWIYTWYRPRAGEPPAKLAGHFARLFLGGIRPGEGPLPSQARPGLE